jgi:hypothetical protein
VTKFPDMVLMNIEGGEFFCSQTCHDKATDPNEELKNHAFSSESHKSLILKFGKWERGVASGECESCKLKFNFGGKFSLISPISFIKNEYQFSEEQRKEMRSRLSSFISEDLSFSVVEFLEYPIFKFCNETCFYAFCELLEG